MPEMVAMWVKSWEDPAMRHAILVHFPIVIAVLLIPLSFGAMVWRGSGRTALTVLSLIGCLLLIGMAYVAKESGSEAHQALGTIIDSQDSEAIDQHAQDAVRIWWLGCIAGGLLLFSCVGKTAWRQIFRFAFFLGCIALAGYVAHVADLGGRLVYIRGVGVPHPAAVPLTPAGSPDLPPAKP